MTYREKVARRKYLNNIKKTKRKLIKQAKEWVPYEWSFSLEMLLIAIEGMHTYYSHNYNVCAEESDDVPSRKVMCAEILAAYDRYLECAVGCADWRDEEAAWNEFCDTFKKYFLYLWD